MKKKIKLKKKPFFILIGILLVFILSFIIFIVNSRVVFKLIDEEDNTLLLNKEFKDPGFEAKYCIFNKCRDLKDKVLIKSNIDNKKIGEYQVSYALKYHNKEYEIIRKINVTEKTPPTIVLVGKNETTLCPNTEYKEEGYTAEDNYDGNITDKVSIKKEDNKIVYTVSDSSNNSTEVIRKINYSDQNKPTISLKGKSNISVTLNSSFKDPGFTASDNCDGNITDKVSVEGNVDTKNVGKYKITYTVTDKAGNKTIQTRNVNVYKPEPSGSQDNATLDSFLKNSGYNVSVIYYNIGTGYTYKYNANKVYYGASLIKTLDAMYVYEKMTLTNELRDLVKPTITRSNNSTHKKLVNKIGIDNLRSYGRSLGASKVLTGSNLDYYGNTTANDQLIYMKHLWKVVNNNPNGSELKSYFLNDYFNYLNFSGSPSVMHKYGYYGAYYHDVGIVLDSKPYIIVVLTQEANHNYSSIVEKISKKVYEVHKSL